MQSLFYPDIVDFFLKQQLVIRNLVRNVQAQIAVKDQPIENYTY